MLTSPLQNFGGRIQTLTESLTRALPALGKIKGLQVPCQVATNIVEIQRDVHDLVDEARTLETLSQVAWVVSSELDLERAVQKVTDAATELTGAAFGALFYNVSGADDGEAYQLYSVSGASRAEFARCPLPRNTALLGPTLRGESLVRSDDITRDERFGHNPPYRGLPPAHPPVRSYLAAPVISRTGATLGALFFGHPRPRIFDERAERLALRMAAHAASAIDNARHHEAAQRLILEQLHEVDRRKDEFIAVLAHELRNPLAPLRNGIEIVRQLLPNDAALSRLTDMMARQLVSLARLVDDLSDLSRATHGRLELRRERVPLNKLTPDAAASREAEHVARRRILVADDNTDAADSLSLWLQLDGHEVRTVADGQQVVATAEEFRPEVIFMDLGMPQLDGLAASRKIRAKPWGRNIRIVALTGWSRTEDRLRSQAAGIDVHWVKPVDLQAIMGLLGTEPMAPR